MRHKLIPLLLAAAIAVPFSASAQTAPISIGQSDNNTKARGTSSRSTVTIDGTAYLALALGSVVALPLDREECTQYGYTCYTADYFFKYLDHPEWFNPGPVPAEQLEAHRRERIAELQLVVTPAGKWLLAKFKACLKSECLLDLYDHDKLAKQYLAAAGPQYQQLHESKTMFGREISDARYKPWLQSVIYHGSVSSKLASMTLKKMTLRSMPMDTRVQHMIQAFYSIPSATLAAAQQASHAWTGFSRPLPGEAHSPIEVSVEPWGQTFRAEKSGILITAYGAPFFGKGYAEAKKYEFTDEANNSETANSITAW